MAALFSADYQLLWTGVLALALFFPVRKLIWVLYIRRAQKAADLDLEPEEQARLLKRAGVTAILLCVVFSYLYTSHLMGGSLPGAGL